MADEWLIKEADQRSPLRFRIAVANGRVGIGEGPGVSTGLVGVPVSNYQRAGLSPATVMAMMDLAAQQGNVPLYQFLGGPTRHKVRVMTALAGGDDAALTTSMRDAHAKGFRAFVVPVPATSFGDARPAFVERTRARLDKLKTAAPDCDFVLQGRPSLTPAEANDISAAIERLHPLWFDTPAGTDNLAALKKITRENVTPVGLDAAKGLPDLLREQVIDIASFSLATVPLTQIRKLAALAETYYTAVALRVTGGAIATSAALHLAASLPNFFIAEIPRTTGIAIDNGFAPLPTGIGIGVTEGRP